MRCHADAMPCQQSVRYSNTSVSTSWPPMMINRRRFWSPPGLSPRLEVCTEVLLISAGWIPLSLPLMHPQTLSPPTQHLAPHGTTRTFSHPISTKTPNHHPSPNYSLPLCRHTYSHRSDSNSLPAYPDIGILVLIVSFHCSQGLVES